MKKDLRQICDLLEKVGYRNAEKSQKHPSPHVIDFQKDSKEITVLVHYGKFVDNLFRLGLRYDAFEHVDSVIAYPVGDLGYFHFSGMELHHHFRDSEDSGNAKVIRTQWQVNITYEGTKMVLQPVRTARHIDVLKIPIQKNWVELK